MSVTSISSCWVTCGISVHDLTKCGPESFLTRGRSCVAISPNSSWEYSSTYFVTSFFCTSPWETVTWDLTKFFTSSAETLPARCVPEILEISAPSSLANFLIFGLAELFPEGGTLGAGFCCCTWTTSFCFFSFRGFFLDFSFTGSFCLLLWV